MHFRRFISACGVLAILVFASGCGQATKKKEIDNKVPLVKVHGIVHVNKEPKKNVMLVLKPIGQIAEKRKLYTNLSCQSNEKGEFAFSTYEPYDGVPKGEYNLHAMWKVNRVIPETGRSEVVDHFKGKYFQIGSGIKKFTAADSEVDLGVIDLQAATLPTNP